MNRLKHLVSGKNRNKEIELWINQYWNAHNATKFGAMQPDYKSSAYFLALPPCVTIKNLFWWRHVCSPLHVLHWATKNTAYLPLLPIYGPITGKPLHFNTDHFYFCWFYMKQISTPTSKFHFDKLFELYYKIHKKKQASLIFFLEHFTKS